ncbi:MAG TPA: helix-turn-helix domain-containing protein [Dehalococcoidia bacterium]|nr:helix-turn-helix domain-containing protein [Dehalococcoidia bacterium]
MARRAQGDARNMGHGDFCTVAEVADMLGVSASTVWRWVDSGKMPAVRVGPKAIRIRREDAEAAVRPVEFEPDSGIESAESLRAQLRPLTEAEKQRALEAFEAAVRIGEEIHARRKGRRLPDSAAIIRAAREERSRRL